MPPLLTNSNASCRSEKLTAIVPPQSSCSKTCKRHPDASGAAPNIAAIVNIMIGWKAFWTGLIDRHARRQTQAALCLEPEVNAMSIVGFFRRARGVNSVRSLPFGWEGLRRIQASLGARRLTASADRMG